MDYFSDIVKQRLKYYVYALIDPRDNEVFYIGKGTNDRIFQHEAEDMTNSEIKKLNRMSDIINSHNDIKKVIILYGLEEDAAFVAEAALINMINYFNISKLTNAVAGHHSDSVMTVEEIEKVYGTEELTKDEIHHNLLVVKINSLYRYDMEDNKVMDCARGHWVINTENANKSDYLVAIYHGLIVGIYENMKWYSSGQKTTFYPRLCEENLSRVNRKYCTCSPVEKQSVVYQKYMNKNISNLVKGVQNPVSYIWAESTSKKI